jgi:NAD+ synthase (glutamine-hydrolysing)
MKLLKVAAAVVNQTPLAWEQNQRNIVSCLEEARARGASLVCLPELCITGYGCEDAFFSRGLQQTAVDVLLEIVPQTRGLIACIGVPLLHKNGLYNTSCLAVDGRIAGFAAKRYLAGDGIHYEPRWFKAWPDGVFGQVAVGDGRYPIGDLFFEVGGVGIGFEICEDAWVATRPGAELASRGADLILNPSASHFAFDKHEIRKRFVLEGSRAFGVSYVYSNLLGNEAGRITFDGDSLIANAGKLVAQGPRFSFADFKLTCATVDIDATRMAQTRNASFRPDLQEQPAGVVRVPFAFPALAPEPPPPPPPPWESGTHVKEEEFTRAEGLALIDYLRKSRSAGAVVSLSGGADSSAVACLVSLMAELCANELGLSGLISRLGYIKELEGARSVREVVHRLLLCVYQPTQNSSATTRHAAQAVAEALNAEFVVLDVDALVRGYTELISGAIGRPLQWASDDLALQNIQARVRSPSVWMLANLRNALLLTTSNRSEAAVGYATMDGDTSGGLAPIGGIDKNFLRAWLRWLEKIGPHGLHPIPALAAVNEQAPTAELRPLSTTQTDEEDLMPYDLLDAVERAAIRDKHTPVEVFVEMRVLFPQYSAPQLGLWVERFFRLWCRNQWKRERYAPSFHVDDENLDPKTWCRFPILSSGFERELRELKALVEKTAKNEKPARAEKP